MFLSSLGWKLYSCKNKRGKQLGTYHRMDVSWRGFIFASIKLANLALQHSILATTATKTESLTKTILYVIMLNRMFFTCKLVTKKMWESISWDRMTVIFLDLNECVTGNTYQSRPFREETEVCSSWYVVTWCHFLLQCKHVSRSKTPTALMNEFTCNFKVV